MLRSIMQALTAGNVYRRFLEKVVHDNKIWTLKRNGEYVLADSIGKRKVPFWSSREDAEACMFGGWADSEIECITLAEFVNVVLPFFQIEKLEIIMEMKEGIGVYKPVPIIAESVKREARKQNVSLSIVSEPERFFEQGNVRYRNFIDNTLENREVWLLVREGASVLAKDGNKYCIPIWSTEEAAENARKDGWEKAAPEACFLKNFIEEFIPVHRRDYPMAFVDMKEGEGIPVHLGELEKDLKTGAEEKGFHWDEFLPEQAETRQINDEIYAFLKEFLENKRVWFLHTEDGLACVEDEDGEWVPVWNTADAAEEACRDGWEEHEADAVSLADFLNEWIDDLGQDYDGAALCYENGMLTIGFQTLKEMIDIQADEMGLKEEDLYFENIEYLRFLWNIIRTGKVWILDNGEDIAILEHNGVGSLPVWCCREDARADCTDEWKTYDAESVPLPDFIKKWMPDLEEEGFGIFAIVMPEKGIFMDVQQFRNDLLDEIQKKEPDSLLLKSNNEISNWSNSPGLLS